jgi:peptide/nickel transport system substrate-binding protein
MYDPFEPQKIIGDLATGWKVSEDGKVYTFTITNKAAFHDGVPLTSADVKFTYDFIRNPPKGVSSIRKGALEVIDSIDTPDATTVIITLKRPSPSFITNMATGWMLVLPKHILEVDGHMKEKVIGSGPFMLKKYIRGTSIELVKNPNYHVPNRPFLDGVKIFIVPDVGTTYSYFRSEQIHVFEDMPSEDVKRAQASFGNRINVQTGTGYGIDLVAINSAREPWNDIRVRQAASLAINRYEGAQLLRRGDARVSGMFPPGPWNLSDNELQAIPGYGTDGNANLAEAKRLLAEAGKGKGFATTMIVRKIPASEEIGIFVKDQLGKIGINVKLVVQEDATNQQHLYGRDFDLAALQATMLANDPDSILGDMFLCESTRNYSQICDTGFDAMFPEQSQTLDVAKRKVIVDKMQKKVLADAGMLILFFRNRYRVSLKTVHNFLLHPEVDNNRRMQEVWLET